MDKTICKVHGRIAPGAMCGKIIVGMVYCGFSGECIHKSTVHEEDPIAEIEPVKTTKGNEE